jgi:hypothetical protein
MNLLRQIFRRPGRGSGSQFDRYYTAVLREGEGYPTADEARRDLSRYERTKVNGLLG